MARQRKIVHKKNSIETYGTANETIMQITHFENKLGLELILTPETMKEVNELARLARNAKKEPASMYLSFSGETPSLQIWFTKVDEKRQYNSIRPYQNK